MWQILQGFGVLVLQGIKIVRSEHVVLLMRTIKTQFDAV